MNILALIGSPRKKSNTDTLVDRVLAGAASRGHAAEKVYLYGLEIGPCLDCRKCKKGGLVCPIPDGMAELYPRLEAADLIVFGTPNYWYGPTAKMKLFIDRLRPFIANGKLKGKQAAVVVPAAEGPSACGPMLTMFEMSFEYIGVDLVGRIVVKAYERGEIKDHPDELDRAFELGASFQGPADER
jgi:multimeric flavodoxin WrbA